MLIGTPIEIRSRDYWVKVVDFLQQNWALVGSLGNCARVWFIHDLSGVFDDLDFDNREAAEQALLKNGFERSEPGGPAPPPAPFVAADHPNGRIYSSGRYWI